MHPLYCWPVLKPHAALLPGSFQNIRSFFYAVSDNYFIMIFHIDDIPLSLYMLQTYCCSWTNAISFAGICNIPSHTWLLSHGYNNIVSGFFAVYLYLFKPVARGVCPIYEWSMRSVRDKVASLPHRGWMVGLRFHITLYLSNLDLRSKTWAIWIL